MKKIFLITILCLLVLVSTMHGAVTRTLVHKPNAYWWKGDPIKDTAWLWANEIEDLLEATAGTNTASIALIPDANLALDYLMIDNASKGYMYFEPTTVPTSPSEGFFYCNDANNAFEFYNGSAWVNLSAGAGDNTLDNAYDQPTGGAGAKIDADAGCVEIEVDDNKASTAQALLIDYDDVTNNNDCITIENAGTGIGIDVDGQTSGRDFEGTGASCYITGAGLVKATGITSSDGLVNLNVNSNNATNINTGTSNAAVTIGGGTNNVSVNSATWDITTTGAISTPEDITLANGKALRSSTTGTETVAIKAYDGDNTTYRSVITLTNADTIALALGTGYETVAVASTTWDVSTTGVFTGIGAVTSDGTITTTGVGGVVSPIFTAAATTNIGSKFSRNQGTTTAMLLELETTNTGDDRSALLIDHNANTAVDAAQIENDGTAAGLHITGGAAGSVGIDVDVAASATGRALYVDLATWLGTGGQGAIEVVTTSAAHIPAGQLLRLNQAGTGKHASAIGGSVIYVADTATAPDSGTSYSVYLNPTNIEAMHVDNGDVLVDDKVQAGTLQATTLLDVDEDVDVDFDAADEEVNITASAKDYATGSGVVTVYDSNTAGQDNASYLLRLARYGDADAEGHFILCEDNSSGAAANGDDMFKVDATGAMTVAGTATLSGNVVRTGQQYIQTIGYCKVGSTGGWVVPAAADAAHLATLPQSQTASTLIIPITIPLKVGWTITAWTLNGQIDSAGNTATLDAKLYEHVEATGGFSNAAIGSGMAQLSKTADYKVVEGESSLTETVAVGDSYYLLITGTTAATTDIEIAGITVTVSEL